MTSELETFHVKRGSFFVSQMVMQDVLLLDVLGTVEDVVPADALAMDVREASGDSWPGRELQRLDHRLRGEVMAVVAVVSARPGRVSVCTAGDIRVHVGWGGRLQAATRDHVYSTDKEVFGDVSGREALLEGHDTMVTRFIGGRGSPFEPEFVGWDTPDEYELVICSSEVHRHRAPETYFASIAEEMMLGEGGGFLGKVTLRQR